MFKNQLITAVLFGLSIPLAAQVRLVLDDTNMEALPEAPLCLSAQDLGTSVKVDAYYCHKGISQEFHLKESPVESHLTLSRIFAGNLMVAEPFAWDFGSAAVYYDKNCSSVSYQSPTGIRDLHIGQKNFDGITLVWRLRTGDCGNQNQIARFAWADFLDSEEAPFRPLIKETLERLQSIQELVGETPPELANVLKELASTPGHLLEADWVKVRDYTVTAIIKSRAEANLCLEATAQYEGAELGLARCLAHQPQLWDLTIDGGIRLHKTDLCLGSSRGLFRLYHCSEASAFEFNGGLIFILEDEKEVYLSAPTNDLVTADEVRFQQDSSRQEWLVDTLSPESLERVGRQIQRIADYRKLQESYDRLLTMLGGLEGLNSQAQVVRDEIKPLKDFLTTYSFADNGFEKELDYYLRRQETVALRGKLRPLEGGDCKATSVSQRKIVVKDTPCDSTKRYWYMTAAGLMPDTSRQLRNELSDREWKLEDASVAPLKVGSSFGSSRGGVVFDDFLGSSSPKLTRGTKISMLTMRSPNAGGWYDTYSRWMGYTIQTGNQRVDFVHGKGRDRDVITNWRFGDGAYLVELKVCIGTRYHTRKRIFAMKPVYVKDGEIKEYPWIGQTTNNCYSLVNPKDRDGSYKYQIVGFYGRKGDNVDRLGAYFSPLP